MTVKQQTGNALHTRATEHGFEPRSRLACRGDVAFVFLGCLPNQSNGGRKLLPKRAKKHSIAANTGELKATFGPGGWWKKHSRLEKIFAGDWVPGLACGKKTVALFS